jgi:DNA modification methylase
MEIMKIDELCEAPYNPRGIRLETAAALRRSLSEFGDISGITYNRQTGQLVCGHQRVKQLRRLGSETRQSPDGRLEIVTPAGDVYPVRVVDWPEEKEKAANVTANNQHIAGSFTDGLQPLLEELREDLGLEKLADLRLDHLMTGDGRRSKDDIAEPGAGASAQAGSGDLEAAGGLDRETGALCQDGDLWVLGEHRLLCGSSRRQEDVDRLTGGLSCDALVTSPPYALETINLRGTGADRTYNAHDDDATDWPRLMAEWWEACTPYVIGATIVNVQLLRSNKRELVRWLAERADRLCDIAIWSKGRAAPASHRQVLNSAFEFILIFAEPGANRAIPMSTFHGTVSNVYSDTARPEQTGHRAAMPIPVCDYMLHLVDNARTILEPFSGSGTTIVACEQLGRRCFAMEIDPVYCDIAIRRWEKLTGQTAVRV